MKSPVDVRDRLVAHFTHVDNLPSIVSAGFLSCDHRARQGQLATEVGDVAIKENRRRRAVLVGPGDTVGDYVPFYFASRSPMMFKIACDRRGAVPDCYQGGDHPLVYLVTTVGAVVASGLSWVVTDGNAASAITRFTTSVDDADQMIDWPLMAQTMWNSTPDDPDRQRRRAAELLIHREAPLTLFHSVAAYSDTYAQRARVALGDHPLAQRVDVRPDWYYGYERRGAP